MTIDEHRWKILKNQHHETSMKINGNHWKSPFSQQNWANDRFLALIAIFTSSLQPRFCNSTPDLPESPGEGQRGGYCKSTRAPQNPSAHVWRISSPSLSKGPEAPRSRGPGARARALSTNQNKGNSIFFFGNLQNDQDIKSSARWKLQLCKI